MPDLDEHALYAELGRRAGTQVGAGTAVATIGLDSVQWLDFVGWLADHGVAAAPADLVGARTAGELYAALPRTAVPDRPRPAAPDRPGPAAPNRPGPAAPNRPEPAPVPFDVPGPADPGPASALLTGPTYELCPVDPRAMDFLYNLAVSTEVGYRWRFRGSVPNYETFEATFWQGTLCQFIAVERASGQPCGHVVCYNPELAHGYGSVAAVFLPDRLGTGAPLQCVGSFIRYVFTVWPMRKLYLEVPAFNYAQFSAGNGRLFVEEGRLAEHDYYAGRYWDRHILAVYRRHAGLDRIPATGG
jgi:RimJ/RimL family protein N-acetyltransferase